MMWKKSNSKVKKLMTDIVVRKISVGRLICVRTMNFRSARCCVMLLACAMLTACGVHDKALVLTGEEENVGKQAGDEEILIGQAATASEMVTAVGSEGQSDNLQAATIVVFVCGAVQNPGIVELPEGSRAADALEAVGGLLDEAQPDYVNLAVKLEDAQKLYFPTAEEVSLPVQEERKNASGPVNINTADKERLCTLPGIGETRAEAIIAYREKNGDFRSKEDIMKVSGIKQNAYDKLREHITVE